MLIDVGSVADVVRKAAAVSSLQLDIEVRDPEHAALSEFGMKTTAFRQIVFG